VLAKNKIARQSMDRGGLCSNVESQVVEYQNVKNLFTENVYLIHLTPLPRGVGLGDRQHNLG
jgi:hypothetical protein